MFSDKLLNSEDWRSSYYNYQNQSIVTLEKIKINFIKKHTEIQDFYRLCKTEQNKFSSHSRKVIAHLIHKFSTIFPFTQFNCCPILDIEHAFYNEFKIYFEINQQPDFGAVRWSLLRPMLSHNEELLMKKGALEITNNDKYRWATFYGFIYVFSKIQHKLKNEDLFRIVAVCSQFCSEHFMNWLYFLMCMNTLFGILPEQMPVFIDTIIAFVQEHYYGNINPLLSQYFNI